MRTIGMSKNHPILVQIKSLQVFYSLFTHPFDHTRVSANGHTVFSKKIKPSKNLPEPCATDFI